MRIEEAMAEYDDKVERRLEESAAQGFYWGPRAEPDPNQLVLFTARDEVPIMCETASS
jgi:hypothetical protein